MLESQLAIIISLHPVHARLASFYDCFELYRWHPGSVVLGTLPFAMWCYLGYGKFRKRDQNSTYDRFTDVFELTFKYFYECKPPLHFGRKETSSEIAGHRDDEEQMVEPPR